MQCGEHDQVARPLFEDLIEVPDFEMAAHADQQRALGDTAPRPHPRCDAESSLAVHLRRCDESEPPPQQRIAGTAVPAPRASRQLLMMLGDAVTIVDQHARIVGVETDKQILPSLSCLDGDAEVLGKIQFAPRIDRRYRASYEKFVHDRYTLNIHEASA